MTTIAEALVCDMPKPGRGEPCRFLGDISEDEQRLIAETVLAHERHIPATFNTWIVSKCQGVFQASRETWEVGGRQGASAAELAASLRSYYAGE